MLLWGGFLSIDVDDAPAAAVDDVVVDVLGLEVVAVVVCFESVGVVVVAVADVVVVEVVVR